MAGTVDFGARLARAPDSGNGYHRGRYTIPWAGVGRAAHAWRVPIILYTAFHRRLLVDFCRYLLLAVAVLGSVLALFGLPALLVDPGAIPGYAAAVLQRVLPLALLVAALFSVGIRSRYLEITALNAAGVPLAQATWPVLLPAAVAALVSFALAEAGFSANAAPGGVAELRIGAAQHAAHALVDFVAVLWGVIVAAGRRRAVIHSRFLAGGVLLLAYYVIDATTQAFGRHGGLAPWLVAWLPVSVTGIPAAVIWTRGR